MPEVTTLIAFEVVSGLAYILVGAFTVQLMTFVNIVLLQWFLLLAMGWENLNT